jgi:hypothetical protein
LIDKTKDCFTLATFNESTTEAIVLIRSNPLQQQVNNLSISRMKRILLETNGLRRNLLPNPPTLANPNVVEKLIKGNNPLPHPDDDYIVVITRGICCGRNFVFRHQLSADGRGGRVEYSSFL